MIYSVDTIANLEEFLRQFKGKNLSITAKGMHFGLTLEFYCLSKLTRLQGANNSICFCTEMHEQNFRVL